MMSNRSSLFLKEICRKSTWNRRVCSTVPTSGNDKDPAPMFFDERIQDLLTRLTRFDYEKIFTPRKDGTPLTVPTFKFMTDEELQEARLQIEKKARRRIQMPPVVKPRDKTVSVLSKDIAIQGFSNKNYVFTDISFGGTNRNRLIVVREPSGTLRHANSNERHRMNQMFFPIKDREMHIPKMFTDPYFSDLLEKEKFEFILDRACLQFEPDDPEYHKITRVVYSRVNKWRKFDALRSTRHFGPFVFHLAWEKNIDGLLEDLIKTEKVDEATALIELYHCLNPDAKSVGESSRNSLELIKQYAEMESSDRQGIIRALEIYQHLQEEKQKLKENLKKMHGLIEETDEPKT